MTNQHIYITGGASGIGAATGAYSQSEDGK